MGKRIAAIVFIFACTSVAWMILGATIFARTENFGERLSSRVQSTWGTAQVQYPPSASWGETVPKLITRVENNHTIEDRIMERVEHPVQLGSSAVDVAFDLDYRQKGLLWYSTYAVNFDGAYTFTNATNEQKAIEFKFPFPAERAIYDEFRVTIDGKPVSTVNSGSTAVTTALVQPGETVKLGVGYKSQGMSSWQYNFGKDVTQVKDFALNMKTNFRNIDFAENTLSPTEKKEIPGGWQLSWNYRNLVSGFQIGMLMPEKLQPGPLAGQISFFAPVSLFFFFFLMFIITTIRGIELHPMNYFFLAAAFFAFHLLLAYLADHISIHLAFVICSAVSIFLVGTYLRLVVGMRFAAVEAAVCQFIYLVMFSYAFFFKGFTGLSITIGSIITLFVVMQMTGRIRWAERFAKRPLPAPAHGD